VLVLTIDPEERGVLPADPDDESFALDRRLEVVVRYSSTERLDDGFAARPELGENGLEVHGRS